MEYCGWLCITTLILLADGRSLQRHTDRHQEPLLKTHKLDKVQRRANHQKRESDHVPRDILVNIKHRTGHGDLVVDISSQVELTCEVNHIPDGHKIRWLFRASNVSQLRELSVDGIKISSGDFSVLKRKRFVVLYLSSVSKEMNGTYICEVRNDQKTVKDDQVQIIIKEPHVVMTTKKIGELGQLVEFVCLFDGVEPWHNVRWTRETMKYVKKEIITYGMSMTMTQRSNYWSNIVTHYFNGSLDKHTEDTSLIKRVDHVIRNHPDGSRTFHLILRDLGCADNGTFRCSVTHNKGVSPANTRLILVSQPSQPSIINTKQGPTSEGETFLLTCQSNVGIPAGVLSWYQELVGGPIEKLETYQYSTESRDCTYTATASILIHASRDKHHAVYTCYATRVGQRPTLVSTRASFTLVLGKQPILPLISLLPGNLMKRHSQVSIRCTLSLNSPNTFVALYRSQRKSKYNLTGSAGELIAYMDEHRSVVLIDAKKYQSRLYVRGSDRQFELVIKRVGCVDAGEYRCGATRFSEPALLSVVDFTESVSMATHSCRDVSDDEAECRDCPYLAKTGQDLPVTCRGYVAFPNSIGSSRFVWSVKTTLQRNFTEVTNTTTILGARPISDVTETASGCLSEYRTSLFIYRPDGLDENIVQIGCRLEFTSSILRHASTAEITVCVQKGSSVKDRGLPSTPPAAVLFLTQFVLVRHFIKYP